jgi:putative FmdB family regulatory protein
MPLYEYKCEKCGDIFEVMQKFADEPLRVHEKCGGLVNRLLSAPALQFKGSGWYVNDYAKAGKSDASGGSSKTESSDKKDSGDKKSGGEKKESSSPSPATSSTSSSSSEGKSS